MFDIISEKTLIPKNKTIIISIVVTLMVNGLESGGRSMSTPDVFSGFDNGIEMQFLFWIFVSTFFSRPTQYF